MLKLLCRFKADEAVVIIMFLVILIEKPDAFFRMPDICIGMFKVAAVLINGVPYFLIFCQWCYLLPAFTCSAAVQTIPAVSSEIHSQKATKKFPLVCVYPTIWSRIFYSCHDSDLFIFAHHFLEYNYYHHLLFIKRAWRFSMLNAVLLLIIISNIYSFSFPIPIALNPLPYNLLLHLKYHL